MVKKNSVRFLRLLFWVGKRVLLFAAIVVVVAAFLRHSYSSSSSSISVWWKNSSFGFFSRDGKGKFLPFLFFSHCCYGNEIFPEEVPFFCFVQDFFSFSLLSFFLQTANNIFPLIGKIIIIICYIVVVAC